MKWFAAVFQVIRVWRASDGSREQSSKLIGLRKRTTSLEAARLATEEFGIPEYEREAYCLCQVSRAFRSRCLFSVIVCLICLSHICR